jgi:hypothetical protein
MGGDITAMMTNWVEERKEGLGCFRLRAMSSVKSHPREGRMRKAFQREK